MFIGKDTTQVQRMADEEFSLRKHLLHPSAILNAPCDYGVAKEERRDFCCSGMALNSGSDCAGCMSLGLLPSTSYT